MFIAEIRIFNLFFFSLLHEKNVYFLLDIIPFHSQSTANFNPSVIFYFCLCTPSAHYVATVQMNELHADVSVENIAATFPHRLCRVGNKQFFDVDGVA